VTSLAIFILALQADNILSIDGSFLFIFFLVFCLIFILNATLFRPINQVLDERERLSSGRMSEAQRIMAQYEERLRRYEEQVRATRAESYQRLEAQRRAALAHRQEIIAQVKAETAEQITAAKQEIAAQTSAARASLEREARTMAVSISSRILHRPITPPEGIGA
jgi:F-type H+-transporting ATPase subunit b